MKKLILLAVLALGLIPARAQSLSDLAGVLSGVVEDLTASGDFKIADIAGTWKYAAPAVSFKGDNALKNIGGSAAASSLEAKLKPYYERAGLTGLTIVINADSTFSMAMKKATLTGTIAKDADGLVFTFNRAAKYPVKCMATKSAGKLNLTFDSSKLVTAIQTASKYVNVSALKAASTLLSSYDGVYIGFQLTPETADK